MKTNWQHQKDAITTDQKNRVDDEHIHELDKQRVKQSEKQASPPADQVNKQASTAEQRDDGD